MLNCESICVDKTLALTDKSKAHLEKHIFLEIDNFSYLNELENIINTKLIIRMYLGK